MVHMNRTYTDTAANLYTGDKVGKRTVLETEVLGDLVRIVWSVPQLGDYRAEEEFVLATRPYRIAL